MSIDGDFDPTEHRQGVWEAGIKFGLVGFIFFMLIYDVLGCGLNVFARSKLGMPPTEILAQRYLDAYLGAPRYTCGSTSSSLQNDT